MNSARLYVNIVKMGTTIDESTSAVVERDDVGVALRDVRFVSADDDRSALVGDAKGADDDGVASEVAPLTGYATRSVRSAVIGNFVDIFGLCTILPIIPFFVKKHGEKKIWVGLISGAQFLGCCVGNFTWGQCGDRFNPNGVALGLMIGDVLCARVPFGARRRRSPLYFRPVLPRRQRSSR